MKLFFATANQNKVKELAALFSAYDIDIVSVANYPDFISPPETGVTFQENAQIKAECACQFTGLPSLADDSGLVVAALKGAPGVYSARYAGENATDEENNEKLLAEMKDIPEADRKAYFCSVLCLALPKGETIFSEGRVYGRILRKRQGENGFGYDPLFYVDEMDKAMAELTLAEKNMVSHRGLAFRAMKDQLLSLFLATDNG
ncbi:MAG TPA: XTP/dITP diphosphatase [Clostridiales bacterium]|nr:XTP/dITP diphosphatase [Clostridiales bacterium]